MSEGGTPDFWIHVTVLEKSKISISGQLGILRKHNFSRTEVKKLGVVKLVFETISPTNCGYIWFIKLVILGT